VTQALWIPGPLPGLNEVLDARGVVMRNRAGGTRRFDGYAKLKRAWATKIGLYAREQQFTRVEFAAFSYLFVESSRRRDPSNIIAGGVKLLEDSLQEAGLLAGDGWANVTAIAPYWVLGVEPGVLVVCGESVLSKAQLVAAVGPRRVA
jgi:hypothetical protein